MVPAGGVQASMEIYGTAVAEKLDVNQGAKPIIIVILDIEIL